MRFLDLPPLARISAFLDSVDVGDCYVTGELEAYSCKLAGLDKKLSRSLDAEVATGCSPAELSKSPVGPLSDAGARRTLVYLILTLNAAYPDYDFGGLRARHFRKENGLAAVEDAVDAHLLEVARVWDATPGHGGGGGGGGGGGLGLGLGDPAAAPPESSSGAGEGGGAAGGASSAAGGGSSSAGGVVGVGSGGGGGTPFLDALWRALDDAASLAECDVYSYRPDGSGGGDLGNGDPGGLASTSAPAGGGGFIGVGSGTGTNNPVGQASDCYEGGDPFADEGAVWSFNFFFHNRRLKRIVYFACRGVSKSAGSYEGGGIAGRYFGALGGGEQRGGERGRSRGDGLGGIGLGLGGNTSDYDDDDDGRGGPSSSAERYNSDGDDGEDGYYRDQRPAVVVGSRGALPEYGGVEVDDDEDLYGDRRSGGGGRRAGGGGGRRGTRGRRGRSGEDEIDDDDDENADAVADVVAEALADDTAVALAAGNNNGGGGEGLGLGVSSEDVVAGEIDDL